MALEVRPRTSALQIKYDLGTDENGRRKTKTRTLTGIKVDAADQDVYDIVNSIIALQQHAVSSLTRIDYSEYAEV